MREVTVAAADSAPAPRHRRQGRFHFFRLAHPRSGHNARTDPSRSTTSGSDHQSQPRRTHHVPSMFWTKRVVIGDGERGLVYRNRQFERVLGAGRAPLVRSAQRIEVGVHNIAKPEYAGNDADALIARLGDRLDENFVLADIGHERSRPGAEERQARGRARAGYAQAVLAGPGPGRGAARVAGGGPRGRGAASPSACASSACSSARSRCR